MFKYYLLLSFLLSCSHNSFREVAESSKKSAFIKDVLEFLKSEANNNPTGEKFDFKELEIPFVDIKIDSQKISEIGDYKSWENISNTKVGESIIVDQSKYLSEEIRKKYIFEKEGERYIRYYFHPYDTFYRQKVLDYLNFYSIVYINGSEKGAYSTASRSVVIVDEKNDFAFSVKLSTNKTSQGADNFQNRPLPARYAYLARRISDAFYNVKNKLKYLKVGYEPLAIAIPALDQAQSIRVIGGIGRAHYGIRSGFVYLDEDYRLKLAKSAKKIEKEYWENALIKKGMAMAEQGLYLGFYATSNHAQNFRWVKNLSTKELEGVELIDITDGTLWSPVISKIEGEELIEDWNKYSPESKTNSILTLNDSSRIFFSYFFREDWGGISENDRDLIKKGIAIRTAEILGIENISIIENALNVEFKNYHLGWSIYVNAPKNKVIKDALKKHLSGLKKSCARELKIIL